MIAHIGALPLEELCRRSPAPAPASGGARVDNAPRAIPPGAGDVNDTATLRMERTFQAPAQAVFDAWTSEEVLRRWWRAAHDWETTEASVDLRVGGAVRVVMRDPHKDLEYGGGTLHGDRPAAPARLHLVLGRQRQAATDRDRLRGGRGRHDGPLHPPRPVGRGGRAVPRGRLGEVLRQPGTGAGRGSRCELAALSCRDPETLAPQTVRQCASAPLLLPALDGARSCELGAPGARLGRAERERACAPAHSGRALDQSRSPALADIIGARRVRTVAMISRDLLALGPSKRALAVPALRHVGEQSRDRRGQPDPVGQHLRHLAQGGEVRTLHPGDPRESARHLKGTRGRRTLRLGSARMSPVRTSR
jgi:hypothetical protein